MTLYETFRQSHEITSLSPRLHSQDKMRTLSPSFVKESKGKAVPLHAMEALGGR
jgi:hypothetical protein